MKILGFNYKRKEICWGDQDHNFVEFPGGSFVLSGTSKGKRKIPRVFFLKKYVLMLPPPPPHLDFSSPLYNCRCNSRGGLVEFV